MSTAGTMETATPRRRFMNGDVVFHRPTGETWSLIRDEDAGKVWPGGWPPSMADAADCALVKCAAETALADTREELRRLREAAEGLAEGIPTVLPDDHVISKECGITVGGLRRLRAALSKTTL